jgi:uncharacterized membrane protein/predicted DsbA family dithiol-disulfide isomerase
MARTPEAAPSTPTGPRLNLPIFVLALFGVLVVVHLWVQQRADFVFGCTGAGDAASAGGCADVTSSVYSSFLGVSLLAWGAAFYLALAALRVGVAAATPPRSETLRKASFGVATLGILFAAYLVSVQAFVLGQFCVLCLVSSLTVATLFVLHVVEHVKGASPAVALSAALRPYAVAAAAFVVLAGADILIPRDAPATVAGTEGQPVVTAQQIAAAGGISAQCRYDVETPRFRDFDRLLTLETPYEGSADAPVNVVKIFDPNCPHCKTLHQQLERIVPQLASEARFYYKPYPIWDYSIPQVQALYLAGEEGKFFEMLDQQFVNQQVLAALRQQSPDGAPIMSSLVQMAEQIGLDGERVRSEIEARKYVGLIQQQNEIISGIGINSVPKIMIEGRVVASTAEAFTAECLGGLIDLAAREKAEAQAAQAATAPAAEVAPAPADS